MNYRLPCSLDVPAPALICERDEFTNGTYHAHTLECQIGTCGEEMPSPLAWNDARRAIRLTFRETGLDCLASSLTIEAHAHTGDPEHLREIASHLEAVLSAWEALTNIAGEHHTGAGFLRRVAFLFGAEEIAVIRYTGGERTCETFGGVPEVCEFVQLAESRFRAKVLPDPFAEEEAA